MNVEIYKEQAGVDQEGFEAPLRGRQMFEADEESPQSQLQEGQPIMRNRNNNTNNSHASTAMSPLTPKRRAAIVVASMVVFAGLIIGLASVDGNNPKSEAASLGLGSDNDKTSNDNNDNDISPTFSSLARLPYFDESILGGYTGTSGCEDLQMDLMEAVGLMNNMTIDRIAKSYFSKPPPFVCRGGGDLCLPVIEIRNTDVTDGDVLKREFDMDGDVMFADESMPFTITSADNGAGANTEARGEDSFGTNNQVQGVDEADFVKSDGTHVFAAYHNRLVVWTAETGELVSDTEIPTDDDNGIDICKTGTETTTDVVKVAFEFGDEEKEEVEDDANTTCYAPDYSHHWWYRNRNRKNRDLSMIYMPPSDPIKISSLMLNGDSLVVIASTSYSLQNTNANNDYDSDTGPKLQNARNTRVFIYDISQNGMPSDGTPLNLISRKDFQGKYQTARSIGTNAHIVTASTLDSYRHLDRHLNPWSNKVYSGMNETEYRAKAHEVALEKAEIFVSDLTSELVALSDNDDEDDCSKISKVAIMLREQLKSDEDVRPLPSFTDASVLKSFTQVHSFEIPQDDASTGTPETQTVSETDKLTSSSSGVFFPTASYTTNVYASAEKLVIAGEAYTQDDAGDWNERTVLLVYGLEDGSATPEAIGEVPGSLLNQFSMDHYYHGGDSGSDGNGEEGDYLRIATTTWAKWGYVNGTYQQTETSESQISVLKIPASGSDNNVMEIVGNANKIGLGERIYAARFFGEKAYVVTFRQIDPFYTVNLTDPTDPHVVGELKIPGFSNYLHPVNDTLILALGQNATEEGRTSGLQISLFDVSDFSNPIRIRSVTENSRFSSSDAQYDHRAFRYLPESKLLILPLTINAWDFTTRARIFFDGFVVYDVDESRPFSKKFNISQVDEKQAFCGCWSRNSLAARSLVFDGNVTTMKGHKVRSHSLDNEAMLWDLNLDGGEKYNLGYNWIR